MDEQTKRVDCGAPVSGGPGTQTLADDTVKLESRLRSGANWFFWIAGLSVVNSVILVAGGSWNFIIGLGTTQLAVALTGEAGIAGKVLGLLVSLLIAGVFIVFGIFARKRQTWSFIVGMVFYGMDGLLFLVVKDVLSIAFHVLALFFIFNGLRAARQLKKVAASSRVS